MGTHCAVRSPLVAIDVLGATAYWWVTGCCRSLPATPPPHSPHCLHRHQVTTATRPLSHLPIRSPADPSTAPLWLPLHRCWPPLLLRYYVTSRLTPTPPPWVPMPPAFLHSPAAPFFTGLYPAPYAPVALRLYPCANAWSLNCALPSGVNQDPSPFDLDRVTVILATPLDHSADHAHRSAHARPHQPRPPAAPSASPPISPISQAHQ